MKDFSEKSVQTSNAPEVLPPPSKFGQILDYIWPISRSEVPKVLFITLLMFCILGIQNLIRAMKDSVINTMIGTETISFLKFWGVLPAAFLITIGYVKLVSVMKGENIFYLGSESARSRMMGRMLSNQLLKASGQTLAGEEYLDTFEELPSILDKISVYQPDVVLLDMCEWLLHPTFVQALRDIKQRKFSLCTDQR